MIKILWIAPNLNHYKVKFIRRLLETGSFDITVLAGQQVMEIGHRYQDDKMLFPKVTIQSKKDKFNVDPSVYTRLCKLIYSHNFNFVLMPLEKKHFLIILYLFTLKKLFPFRLVSYNHPLIPRRGVIGPFSDKWVNKLLFGMYDRVIFYTSEGRDWTVNSRLLPAQKAFFANNTLDTEGIWSQYNFEINTSESKVILFIGRLVPSKRLDLLLKYHNELKTIIPGVQLSIIGDGPEAQMLKCAMKKDASIRWHGAIVDEAEIAQYMRSAHLVFVPGASGLSIVHTFCYGKPYVTISGEPHGPEITYLKDGENGLILSGDIPRDCIRMIRFLNDRQIYEKACRAAFNKAKELSIANWCAKMVEAFSV